MPNHRSAKAATDTPADKGNLKHIPLAQIELPSSNTRKQMDAAKLKELTASIKQQGVLLPILLRKVSGANGSAQYQIISGERRYRAAQAAGLTEIPANIRTMDEGQVLSANLTENLLREDIHPLDEADGLLRMKEELKLDLRGIAQRLGKDARYVARRLALTHLKEFFRRIPSEHQKVIAEVLGWEGKEGERLRYDESLWFHLVASLPRTKPVSVARIVANR
jgi:ParB family chromosome partitioning protein